MSITTTEYGSFQEAYDFFNRELFGSVLPELLITLQRKAHSMGYFSYRRFSARREQSETHELALNPDTFKAQTDEQILDTLVHEMVHVWQYSFGTPSRSGYHNREWALKMKEAGLQPSSTGKPGGKETGQRMSDYIVEGGPYALAYQRLANTGFKLSWDSKIDSRSRILSKVKFRCPECGQNAWAKPDASLICGHCGQEMTRG
jgi:predicted SprT family Zn-dependent metalloprotease